MSLYAFEMDFAGGDAAAYDRVLEAMGLADGGVPDGAVFHWAAPRPDGGWRVVDVWEDPAKFQEFAEAKIGPLSAAEGFPPPEITTYEIHNTMSR
jgi:hypothetical protein